ITCYKAGFNISF
ncbi:phospholipase A1 family protein, partial [Vibrio parahaemolyticus EKP-021]